MLPQAFLDRIRQQLGPEYEAFLASYDRPRALGLRLNPLKTSRFPTLPFPISPLPWAAHGFWYPPEARPGLHPWHEAGLYYLQEPSAMAPAELLGVEPGQRVLDLCAAPGGKSTQLAAKMQGQGLLVCNEFHPKRAKILAQNVERMAISNALVLQETPERLAKRFPGWFHRVLVDVPGRGCSGRRPPLWPTGARSWWRCARGGRREFWMRPRPFWPPVVVWSTPPAPSPLRRTKALWPLS